MPVFADIALFLLGIMRIARYQDQDQIRHLFSTTSSTSSSSDYLNFKLKYGNYNRAHDFTYAACVALPQLNSHTFTHTKTDEL